MVRIKSKNAAIRERASAAYNRVCQSQKIAVTEVFRVIGVGMEAIEENPEITDQALDKTLAMFLQSVKTK